VSQRPINEVNLSREAILCIVPEIHLFITYPGCDISSVLQVYVDTHFYDLSGIIPGYKGRKGKTNFMLLAVIIRKHHTFRDCDIKGRSESKIQNSKEEPSA